MPKIDSMPIGPIADGEGQLTQEWRDWFEEVVFGTSDNSIGTILSGQNGIINGTQPLADVLITDRGSLITEQDAQSDSINDTAASGGGLSAVASPYYASKIDAVGAGSKTTSSVTVTPSGGVPTYSYLWSKVSGDDIPPDAASSATTTFSGTVTTGEIKNAVYKCTVTDSTGGTPLTTTVNVSVTVGDVSGGIGAA